MAEKNTNNFRRYGRRIYNCFNPSQTAPYQLSRSRLENFLRCPRCFYLDRRLGIDQPPGYPFSLNAAVDNLMKKEFDAYRAKGEPHPLMKESGIDMIPYAHADIATWRENFKGIRHHHQPTNFLISGAIDDIWVSPDGRLAIVDYKATAKDSEVTLDAQWQDGYKRQMEIYQWLFRQNGFPVSPTGYFVYVNGRRNAEAFGGRLEFDMKIIPYEGNDEWVEGAIVNARNTLMSNSIPPPASACDYCEYRKIAAAEERA